MPLKYGVNVFHMLRPHLLHLFHVFRYFFLFLFPHSGYFL
jgi:hypothetical protein